MTKSLPFPALHVSPRCSEVSQELFLGVIFSFGEICFYLLVFKSVIKRHSSCIWLAVPISTKQMLIFLQVRITLIHKGLFVNYLGCLDLILKWVSSSSTLLTGLSDIPGEAMVKLYCPKCMDVYTPKSSRHHHTDGAYFGTGFPHMLFMVHPEYRPKRPANQFVPRLALIFRLHLLLMFVGRFVVNL